MTIIAFPETPAFSCPPWCVRWDHNADVVDANNPPRHYGPDFGIFGTEAIGKHHAFVQSSEPPTTLSAPELRKVAANAIAAAEWLEANR